MNNLLLSVLLLGSGGAILVGQHHSARALRESRREVQAEYAHAALALERSEQELSQAQTALLDRQRELSRRSQVAFAQARAQRLAVRQPDVIDEGIWPPDKPYFYLPKDRLGEIRFPLLTPTETLSVETRIVLGLLPEEQAAADAALSGFLERLRQLQVSRAQRVPLPAGVNSENHRRIAYLVPESPPEALAAREELRAAWRALLGATRTDLLVERLPRGGFRPEFGGDCLVTYAADRGADGQVEHTLTELCGVWQPKEGVTFPLTPGSALWRWRHLFGEEPLLPPTPGAVREQALPAGNAPATPTKRTL